MEDDKYDIKRDIKYDIGMVGLGVMGRNLALNMADKGFSVAGYDTDPGKIEALDREGQGHPARGFATVELLVSALHTPRAVMMMVPAGKPVDAVIEAFVPHLAAGDILIDGGNSHFRETDARARRLEAKQLFYMGVGISGGEGGARLGPSIMPGGPAEGYDRVRPVLEAIAAKAEGEPCVSYLGRGSAGHYVKMVHNGIEYALMQLIAESYDMMKRGLTLTNAELGKVYSDWSTTVLNGYLMEITARIFSKRDGNSGMDLIDVILDEARAKGTGKWTVQDAMDLALPVPTIAAAVAMRDLSDLKDERRRAGEVLGGARPEIGGDRASHVECLARALRTSVVIVFAQAMAQLRIASREYGYDLKLNEVARIWRGGCIIRSALLGPIMESFLRNQDLENLLLDPILAKTVVDGEADLRKAVCLFAEHAIPAPALASCLAYLDAYRSERLPANLIQAQRDFFGSHMYRRVDKEGLFHTEWEE